MSLVMDRFDYHEAYPNGMDEDDMAVWNEAVERNCDHESAFDYMMGTDRTNCHCPDCGRYVEADSDEELDADTLAEIRASKYMDF